MRPAQGRPESIAESESSRSWKPRRARPRYRRSLESIESWNAGCAGLTQERLVDTKVRETGSERATLPGVGGAELAEVIVGFVGSWPRSDSINPTVRELDTNYG